MRDLSVKRKNEGERGKEDKNNTSGIKAAGKEDTENFQNSPKCVYVCTCAAARAEPFSDWDNFRGHRQTDHRRIHTTFCWDSGTADSVFYKSDAMQGFPTVFYHRGGPP